MKLTVPPNSERFPYLDIDFAKGQLQLRWLTKEDKDKLKPSSRDAYFDLTTNTWSIRIEKGTRKGSPRRFPFGFARWELVVLIFFAAAEYVYLPSENHVYAAFARIQEVFGKPRKKKSNYWFEAERNPSYRVRLNPARSYRIISNSNLDGLPHDLLDIRQK
ncbi:hypothetical protein ACFL5Z_09625 [Planctomycetota bacterium]